jgi:hypothetical protein
MFFQGAVTSIIVDLIFVGAINFRVRDRFMHCLYNRFYHFSGIFRGVFTDVIKCLLNLKLRALSPNHLVRLLYHFLISFTNSSWEIYSPL